MRRLAVHIAPVLTAFALLLLAARPSSATEIQRVVSPGGIEAWLVEEHTVPLIAMNFAFAGGSSQDSIERLGTANMVSALLDEGAGDMDAQAFQRRAGELALRYNFDASRDEFFGSIRVVEENIDEGFDLIRLALTAPRFDDDAVERIRGQLLSSLRDDLSEPNTIAGRAWMAAVFPDHPYGRPQEGTIDTVAAISPADLAAFVKANFSRDQLHIAVVGAIDAERLGPLLDRVFGALPEKAVLTPVADVEPVPAPFETVIDTDIAQTVIQFGGPGIDRHDDDFIPAYVLNHIIGGGTFTSRLYDEVREKRGLAYSVYTYLYPLDHAALYAGGVATRADRAAQSLSIIREEIARIAKDGPSQEELDKAKAFLKGSYALRFDTSSKIASQVLGIQLDGLGIDYFDRRNGLIDAVTLDDVKRVSGRLFGTGAPYVTIVGSKAAMAGSGG
ncbi:MAG: insulinase family protein [Rhodobiaceae bacterium]|nr:insulinase family protein [Rhodobiaceae bacterium]MCC0054875.1 insulinase family protein [Rhodobiaceae bacterium]